MEGCGVTLLGNECCRLQGQVRVGGPGAAAGKGDAQAFGPLLDGGGRASGLRHLPAGFALGWCGRVEEEWGNLHIKVVRLLEPLDLDEADVAPRSHKVGEDQQGDRATVTVGRTHGSSMGRPDARATAIQSGGCSRAAHWASARRR